MRYISRTANLLGAVALGIHDRMADVTQARAGRSGVTAAALATIHQYPGLTVEALRRCLGISQPATVRTVNALHARALLVRRPGVDRRSVALHLTPAGHDEAQGVLRARADVLAILLAGLDESDRAVLDRALEQVLARLTTDPQRGDEICRLCDIPACPQQQCPVECAAQEYEVQQRGATTVDVIGAPFNSAGTTGGVANAPARLRETGLISALRTARHAHGDVRDVGDVDVGTPRAIRDPASGLLAQQSLAATTASLRTAVTASIQAGHFPLVLGGDCPVLLGALRGAQDTLGAVGLIFVDGHQDAWPPSRSTTGEAADCELGLALGRTGAGLPPELVEQMPTLDPNHVVALGPRDSAELRAHGVTSLASTITLLTDHELRGRAVFHTKTAVDRVRAQGRSWWLHVDLDVLSTAAMAAVDYPQSGGLGWPDLRAITAAALAPGCIGMTLAIYNPDLDGDHRHAQSIIGYLSDVLAGIPGRVRTERAGSFSLSGSPGTPPAPPSSSGPLAATTAAATVRWP